MHVRRIAAAFAIATLGFAGACTSGRGPEPEGAFLSSARGLELRLTDGQLCRGPRPGDARRWSGSLEGCRVAWPYEVQLLDRTNPLAALIAASFHPLGIEDTLAAAGWVRVDMPDGRIFIFESPGPPPPLRD